MTGSRFSLTKRKETGVYYARFRRHDGSWTTARSTRRRDKKGAIEWCEEQLLQFGVPTGKRIRFKDFADGFYDDGGPWAREYNARKASPVRPSHLRNQRGRLKNYLLPTFGARYLDEITAGDIDRALIHLRDASPKRKTGEDHLSARTVNSLRSCLSEIFKEAVRQGYLRHNPVREVQRLAERPKARGILTADELRRLFDRRNANTIWTDPKYRLITILAATTAARSGELRTLHAEDVVGNRVIIRRSWDDASRSETDATKTGLNRVAPLQESIARELQRWIVANHIQPNEYIFFGINGPSEPMSRAAVIDNFKNALSAIGIPEHEQRRRNLQFHGLRHAATTLLIASGANPWTVRQLTGHRSEAVFNHYADHNEAADWTEIEAWQSALVSN